MNVLPFGSEGFASGVGPSGGVPSSRGRHFESEGNSAARAGRSAASSRAVAPELEHLSRELRRIPDVRADVVEAVKQRLANGDYQTRAAAERTAAAFAAEHAS